MGENHHQATASSRFGVRTTGGEIVEVQGGHIVRSTGRKDRHSKVCTAKGPRDRRVRLSAHTAIQFYDVQDRLGYDRPSKAVDWLIKKAKASIDELAELPAWNPITTIATGTAAAPKTGSGTQQDHMRDEKEYPFPLESLAATGHAAGSVHGGAPGGGGAPTTGTIVGSNVEGMQPQRITENQGNTLSFLPPSLDSDAIANTIKSFFPLGASADTTSSPMQFQNYPPDLLSRTSSQNQDLRLSLQSFQDPILLHRQAHHNQHSTAQNEQLLFSGTTHHYLGFDGSSTWNAADTGSGSGGAASGGGFLFSAPPPEPLLQPLFGQNQFLTQRGTLQSSNTPSVRTWIDPALNADQIPQFHQNQSATSGQGFTPPGGVFSGFRIPGRIQGEEEHGGNSNKLSSATSDSRR